MPTRNRTGLPPAASPSAHCRAPTPCEVPHTRGEGPLGSPGSGWRARPGLYLEVLDVFGAAELGQARCAHQGEEVQEEQPVASQDGVGSLAVAAEPAGDATGALGPPSHAPQTPGDSTAPAPACLLLPSPQPPHAAPSWRDGGAPYAPRPRSRGPGPSPFKFLTIISLSLLNHVDKVIGEDERDSLPVDSKLGLEVPQKVAKINVEQLREQKGRAKTEEGRGGAWRGSAQS